MKKKRTLLSALFALTLAFSLCACGGDAAPSAPAETPESTVAADTGKAEVVESTAPQETESVVEVVADVEPPKVELPVEGAYTLFAAESEGYLFYSGEMEIESVITLEAGGTGTMTMNEETVDITSWTNEESAFTMTITGEESETVSGTVENGVMILDLYGDESTFLYYAQEEADISMFSPMTVEEIQAAMEGRILDTKLGAYWSGLDSADGIHLIYDMHTDYMDANISVESYSKGGMFYTYKLTKVSGYESPSVTVFRDDTAYNLDPEKKTGTIATTVSSSYFSENIKLLDSLYSDIYSYAHVEGCTEETREKDGVTYDVVAYPAGEYSSECAFYFDENGQLVYVEKGAPVIESYKDMGGTTYTIKTIDNEVDESVFDISGYEITE